MTEQDQPLAESVATADEFGAEYRSLSTMAVVALLLGLASTAVFAAPVLLILPVVALMVSVVALRAIAAKPDVLTGRTLAVIGLLLATVSLAGSLTRDSLYARWMSHQARPAAEAWIDLVAAGDVDGSFYLTMGAGDRELYRRATQGEADPKVAGQMQQTKEAYDTDPAVERLSKLGSGVQARWVSDGPMKQVRPRQVRLLLNYVVTSAAGETCRVALLMERLAPRGVPAEWHVAQQQLSDD